MKNFYFGCPCFSEDQQNTQYPWKHTSDRGSQYPSKADFCCLWGKVLRFAARATRVFRCCVQKYNSQMLRVLPLNLGGTCHPTDLRAQVNLHRFIRICFSTQEDFKLSRTPCSERGERCLGEETQGERHAEKLQDMGKCHLCMNLRPSGAK